jgi:hypothetical protein
MGEIGQHKESLASRQAEMWVKNHPKLGGKLMREQEGHVTKPQTRPAPAGVDADAPEPINPSEVSTSTVSTLSASTDSASSSSSSASICHPAKPRYGNSPFCRSCVDQVRWQGERGRAKLRAEIESNPSLSAAMKAEVSERIGAMTEYVRKPEPERRTVDTRKPSVRKHTATVAIVNNLDFDQAAAELKPDATPYEQASLARQLESDPRVNKEIQAQLSTRGLSDDDRIYFVRKLWQLFESHDPRQEAKSLGAMRILGKAFISEKVENTEVEKLQIVGLDEGIRRMQSDPEAQSEGSSFVAEGKRPAKLDMFDEDSDA